MPSSADTAAAWADAALLARAIAALGEHRRDAAEALFAQLGEAAQCLAEYWMLAAALARAGNAPAEALAAQARACELHLQRQGMESPALLLDLGTMALAAGQGDIAEAARGRAAAAISRYRTGQADLRARLRALEAGLADWLWRQGHHAESIAVQLRGAATDDDPDGLSRLQAALSQCGRLRGALAVQLRIVLLLPEAAAAAREMGQRLQTLRLGSAARAWFRRSVALEPGDAVAQALLESVQADGAHTEGADPLVEKLARPLEGLASAPADPVWPMAVAHGLVRLRSGAAVEWDGLWRDATVAALRRVLALRPSHAEAATMLATLLADGPDDGAALAALRAASALAPHDAALHLRLGQALAKLGQMHAARDSFRAALALDPEMPQALLGVAETALALGTDSGALALVDRALALDPSIAERTPARVVRARALAAARPGAGAGARARAGAGAGAGGERGMEKAVEAYRAVLADVPDDPACHLGLGAALLALGRLQEAWPHLAWRWLASRPTPPWRAPLDPLCRPDPAAWRGRTVLAYAEEDVGDALRFLRYVRLMAAGGARVLLEVPASIRPLVAGMAGVAGIYSPGEMVPGFDAAVPLKDLPWAYDTSLETIPRTVPYLRADLTQAARFRRRLAGLPGLKVGLVWGGDAHAGEPGITAAHPAIDAGGMPTLAALAPLAAVRRVVFVSLQSGAASAQEATPLANPPAGMVLHNWTDELTDHGAVASLMTALDLVISVDGAAVHLAGALARKVWLLNRHDCDPAWLPGRGDSPWYPTLRKFRQPATGDSGGDPAGGDPAGGDWAGVLAQVVEALHALARRA